jgi:hypothetical protein
MPQGVSHNPATIRRRSCAVRLLHLSQPALADLERQPQVILGDVAEMVGD